MAMAGKECLGGDCPGNECCEDCDQLLCRRCRTAIQCVEVCGDSRLQGQIDDGEHLPGCGLFEDEEAYEFDYSGEVSDQRPWFHLELRPDGNVHCHGEFRGLSYLPLIEDLFDADDPDLEIDEQKRAWWVVPCPQDIDYVEKALEGLGFKVWRRTATDR